MDILVRCALKLGKYLAFHRIFSLLTNLYYLIFYLSQCIINLSCFTNHSRFPQESLFGLVPRANSTLAQVPSVPVWVLTHRF